MSHNIRIGALKHSGNSVRVGYGYDYQWKAACIPYHKIRYDNILARVVVVVVVVLVVNIQVVAVAVAVVFGVVEKDLDDDDDDD